MTVKEFIDKLEETLNIPEDHHIVPVFETNESDTPIGYLDTIVGVNDDYPILQLEDLYKKYVNKK